MFTGSSFHRLIRAILCVAVVFLLLSSIGPANAQSGGKPPRDVSALLGKMGQSGSVRVIVGLNMAYQADANLSPAAAQLQQAAIQNAQQGLLSILAGQFNVTARYTYVPFIALEVDRTALQALAANPNISSIEEDIVLERTLADSSPLIGANTAWAQGYDGAGQTVAIIDDGVDKNHSFFGGRVVSEACYASDCPGGSGPGPDKGLPCTGCTHGTHVAGIAAGRGSTFSGVARGANIIAIRVFPATGSASYADVLSALERVYALRSTYNIAAVNMSLGSRYNYNTTTCDGTYPAMTTVINNLRTANIATVISSGNDAMAYGYYTNGISFPSCISNAISVGNTTKTNAISSSSQSASILSLLAPGTSINSSLPGGTFGLKSGTSMAAPHVTGAIAILRQHDDSLTVSNVLAAFQNTGLPITDSRNSVTKRRISIVPAMTYYINNEYYWAYTAPPLGYSTSQNPQFATKGASDPQPSCVGTGNFTETVWYKYRRTVSRTIEINTSGSSYDTVLAVYNGATPAAANQIACNDDDGASSTSRVVFTASANTTYWIMVAKWGTVDFTAPATLYLRTAKYIPPSTLFSNALNIPWYSQWLDIDGSGVESTDPPICGSTLYRNTVWYKYTAPVTRWMQVTTHGSYIQDSGYSGALDTVIGVYTGSPGAFTQRGCNDDADGYRTSRTSFYANAGTTYYIMVGKYGSTPLDRAGWVHLTLTHGADTTGVWRPSNRVFYLRNGFSGPTSFTIPYGLAGDIPLIGDWDGDGIETIGVFRPSNRTFYLRNSNTAGAPSIALSYGLAGDLPVVGDWGGLGRTGIGVWRPSTGTFYLKNVASAGPTDYSIRYGLSTDVPVAGDWNGDGIDTVGVWRPSSTVWFFSNTRWCSGCTAATAASVPFGLSTDRPVVGKWNINNLSDTPGVYRNGTWYLRTGLTTGGYTISYYGLAGDLPLAGKYAFKAAPDEPAPPTAPTFVPKQ
jgi:subtilisin family serine protease